MFGVTHNQYYYYFTLATSESEAPNDKSFDNLTKLLKTHFELNFEKACDIECLIF